jgi:hypothetical protein
VHFRSRSLKSSFEPRCSRHPGDIRSKAIDPGQLTLSADPLPLATQSRRVRIGVSTTEFVGIFVSSALFYDAALLRPHRVVNPRAACHVHLRLYYRSSRVVDARPDQAFVGLLLQNVGDLGGHPARGKIGVHRSIGLPRESLSRGGLETDTGLQILGLLHVRCSILMEVWRKVQMTSRARPPCRRNRLSQHRDHVFVRRAAAP